MKLFRKVARVFDGIVGLLAIFAAVLLIFIMLSVGTEVIARYVFARPLIWVIEVTEYSLLFITFLGTAWLLKKEGHVKMDLLLTRLNSRARNSLNIITSLIGAIVCLTIAWFGAWVTWDTLQMGYKMSTELEPPQFLILFIIPLGTFLLFIQFLRRTHGYLEMWRASIDKEQG